jgi:hypothetical protein
VEICMVQWEVDEVEVFCDHTEEVLRAHSGFRM